MGLTYEQRYGTERALELREQRRRDRLAFVQRTTIADRRKPAKFNCLCVRCGKAFQAADKKAKRCDVCRACIFCGRPTPRLSQQSCEGCQARHPTPAQTAQLARIHSKMFGENNPAKQPGVGAKISKSLSANHPAKRNPEPYRLHADRIRPQKVSKLELLAKDYLPGFQYQIKVGFYTVDFIDRVNMVALEIQGCWHHACAKCFPESPNFPTQFLSQQNDKRKHTYLTNQGWTVIYVWEHDLRASPPDAIASAFQTSASNSIVEDNRAS